MNPEKFIPRIRATPVRRPTLASNPSVRNLNGFGTFPRIVAMMFFARRDPSRDACCAVGGWQPPPRISGTSAQSPSAHTPGAFCTRISASTRIFPRSFGSSISSSKGCGAVPAVQTSVKLVIDVPSVSSTVRGVTAFTFVFGRNSIPRSASFRLV